MSAVQPARRPGFVATLGLLTGVAAITVDLSLPAIPDMVAALTTSLQSGQLIVGIFMAGLACGQIPAGLLSDRLGRLPVLFGGMLLFAAGAIAAALATHIDFMLAARFVQGFGAAAAIVLSRAIVRDVASGRDAAALMSIMTMIFTAAPVIAPTIGAVLVAWWGWRAPFTTIAVLGIAILLLIRISIGETHTPNADGHPLRQLRASFAEFFAQRQSIFGLLLLVLPPVGFMSVIAVSAALVVEVYGFAVVEFGLIFALLGASLLVGSFLNRWLIGRFDGMRLIGAGVTLMGLASAQLVVIAALDSAPFVWLWSCISLFMFSLALTLPNATVLALDPIPRVAGVGSSILGTSQNIFGAGGAVVGAAIYNGSVRNSVLLMGIAGLGTLCVFLLRPLIAPGPLEHHTGEVTRD